MQGLIGRKLGMTQVYDDKGHRVAVTVIEAGPCVVVQRKNREKDGYDAVQLGFDEQKPSRVGKASLGRFKKAGTAPMKVLKEFRLNGDDELKEGDKVTLDIFSETSFVDIDGQTKGRGFAGVLKRHNMAGGRKSHGGHSKRRPGAIGQCAYPARVAKGQRMPGRMGNRKVHEENLKVVDIRPEENIIMVRGAVPGAAGSIVFLRKSLKKSAGN